MKKYWLIAWLPIILVACSEFLPDKTKAKEDRQTLRLTLLPQEALIPGKPTTVLAKINHLEGSKALTDAELLTVHTKKIHLLVIDSSYKDYQHIHPEPTSTPGIYKFTFVPQSANSYRAWADVTPVYTKKQEFVMDELSDARKPSIDKTPSQEATIDGYHFSLSFDKPLVAGDESMGTIKVTDGHGSPVKTLEPVLGAFAHIVGFHEDFRTVIHTHPMGAEPRERSAHGDPELMFYLSPKKPGFIKLYAQFKISGKDLFVPFGVKVATDAKAARSDGVATPAHQH